MSSWDPWQREVLAELGLRPMTLAQDQDASAGGKDSSSMNPKLITALARAADCAPRDIAALAGLEPPHDVAARRALWPRLRRMRAVR